MSLLPYFLSISTLLLASLTRLAHSKLDESAVLDKQIEADNRTSTTTVSVSVGQKVRDCIGNGKIRAKVCDPDAVLSTREKQWAERELAELERVTKRPEPASLFGSACAPSGLVLHVLLFRQLVDPRLAQQRLVSMHWHHSLRHPCAKTALVMLSPGPGGPSSVGKTASPPSDEFSLLRSLLLPFLFPSARNEWPKFFALASLNARISALELAEEYQEQMPLIRGNQTGRALVNIVRSVRELEMNRN